MNKILENLPRPPAAAAKYSIGQTISYAGMDGRSDRNVYPIIKNDIQ
jgi:hypothetical protein